MILSGSRLSNKWKHITNRSARHFSAALQNAGELKRYMYIDRNILNMLYLGY